jgi:osmotically inducible protein OsmC
MDVTSIATEENVMPSAERHAGPSSQREDRAASGIVSVSRGRLRARFQTASPDPPMRRPRRSMCGRGRDLDVGVPDSRGMRGEVTDGRATSVRSQRERVLMARRSLPYGTYVGTRPTPETRQEGMPISKVLYTASATVTGGREGRATTSDHALDVKLATPREMGGSGGDGTNPEQLFAAGYAACFLSALQLVAGRARTPLPADTSLEGRVGLGPAGHGGFGLQVELRLSAPGLERAQAEELVRAAHEVCPYSNATRGNIEVTLTVV